MLSFLPHRSPALRWPATPPSRYRPALEALEDRLTPYALSGFQWAGVNVSVSYMPDGTLISSSYRAISWPCTTPLTPRRPGSGRSPGPCKSGPTYPTSTSTSWPTTARRKERRASPRATAASATCGEMATSDEVPPEHPGPQGEPAGTPVDPASEDEDGTRLRQRACDACFAEGSWRTDPMGQAVSLKEAVRGPAFRPEPAAAAPHTATAVVALAVVLGRGVPGVEADPRRQRRIRV
jgi:hypothetical protein